MTWFAPSSIASTIASGASALILVGAATGALAQQVDVSPTGVTSIPAMDVPSSSLYSDEGNASRVEHILTERSLKGKSISDLNAALFGPRLERSKVAYGVTITPSVIGGVKVLVYTPKGGVKSADRDRVLINLHGGGFVGCFVECGGLESIPAAALTGFKVISVDYRLAQVAPFPAATQDVAAVYREVLKTVPARKIGVFGCSAGGLLTAQSLAWFQHHGMPRPGAAGIFCAGGDPGMAGDSRITGMLLGDGERPPEARPATNTPPTSGYLRGVSLTDFDAYPAKDRNTLAGFPPTLVITGTRDFAMSSAVNLHSRLVASGVAADLHVWEGGRHAFFYDVRVPEAREAYEVIRTFFRSRLH